ncbi:ATP-binding cassette, subfamily C, CydD [Pseudonocardia ammonioxydans]|uniref:ATP-binding cassette, subfamily C, CydD n=1 Tax=Pseudonocardia ammonioxydans TaxID=260086 RepID=A0A1I4TXH9_PSUAM|nr:thiol reductant ABC exporter subunit CydD [Pseudonocardia ammonioxydans]SFM81265.1 ATP-binding cassette, subfamily C, CydD [Pseudonocardia ammonioxydans]
MTGPATTGPATTGTGGTGPASRAGGGPPVDPRLLRTASAVRVHLLVAAGCGVAATGLILAQAWLVSRVVAGATPSWGTDGSFLGTGAGLDTLGGLVAAVAVVALARALLSYGAEAAALRSAARAKSQLRMRLVRALATAAPDPARSTGEIVTLATRGLDALDDYFARYLPQLVLAVLVPGAVLVVVADADWISAIVIGVTLPLIPVFMVLVGMHTRARTERQWRLLSRLGGHFLDVVQGLPTLALFRRARVVAGKVRETTDEHRRATMGTLRVAFLSAFVLEVLATLAVALVAVEVGLRLLYGNLDYATALFVLILAPEAYLPLREVGARFHASMEGVAAARQVFDELDRADRTGGAGATGGTAPPPAPAPAGRALLVDDLRVRYPGAPDEALTGLSLHVRPGESVLLRGPSGSGKSTLLGVLLGFVAPTGGTVRVPTGDSGTGTAAPPGLAELDPDAWRRGIAWVPQRPHLFAGSLADNVRLGEPEASDAALHAAARRAGLDTVVERLPQGWDTPLGEGGARLSSGERQRVALARAFLRDAPLVLLDEPTAHLDPDSAAAVRAAAAELLRGRTALVVAHDAGWAGHTDRTVHIDHGRLAGIPGTGSPDRAGRAGAAEVSVTADAGPGPVGPGAATGGPATMAREVHR